MWEWQQQHQVTGEDVPPWAAAMWHVCHRNEPTASSQTTAPRVDDTSSVCGHVHTEENKLLSDMAPFSPPSYFIYLFIFSSQHFLDNALVEGIFIPTAVHGQSHLVCLWPNRKKNKTNPFPLIEEGWFIIIIKISEYNSINISACCCITVSRRAQLKWLKPTLGCSRTHKDNRQQITQRPLAINTKLNHITPWACSCRGVWLIGVNLHQSRDAAL